MKAAIKHRNLFLLHSGLAFVWLSTAIVSVLGMETQALDLLRQAGLGDLGLGRLLILGGAILDAILGLALLIRPSALIYKTSLALMVLMTILATVMLHELWLHPLGPLTKNVPLAIALIILIKAENDPLPDT